MPEEEESVKEFVTRNLGEEAWTHGGRTGKIGFFAGRGVFQI